MGDTEQDPERRIEQRAIDLRVAIFIIEDRRIHLKIGRDAGLDPHFIGGEFFIVQGLQNAGINGHLPLEPARFETAPDAGIAQGAVVSLVVEADFSGYVGRRITVGPRSTEARSVGNEGGSPRRLLWPPYN